MTPRDDSPIEPGPLAEPEEFVLEEAEEAMVDADRTVEVSAVRSALRNRNFRTMWLSALGSGIGTWMQNVILAAYVYSVTRSVWLVSLIGFANLVPQLVFATLGGVIADMFSRKKLIFWLSFEQLLGSLAIAWITRSSDFSEPVLLAAVASVGIGAALSGPVFLSVTPALVPPKDLAGAISLNSVSMNVSRVVGPAIGAMLYVAIGASWVFVLNAATYLFIMIGITFVKVPTFEKSTDVGPLQKIAEGFRFVRHQPVVRRAVGTVFMFSLFCMPFVVVFPAIAETYLHIPAKSTAYGFLYATFGFGAVVGALSIGTFLSGRNLAVVVRFALVGFSLCLATFISLDASVPAFPVAFMLGFCYFAAVTSLSTVFQSQLTHAIRGRVSAIWMMCFGGTVPVSGLIAGWVISRTTINTVIYFGAAFALFLAWFADLRPPEERTPLRALFARESATETS
ncbi:MAG: MFS transporter [Acidobacteria bacterium]|nr:MFS transporter [Acidobacteriota bacterium]